MIKTQFEASGDTCSAAVQGTDNTKAPGIVDFDDEACNTPGLRKLAQLTQPRHIVGESDDNTELMRLLAAARVSIDEQITPDEFLFSWCGVGFMPRQNLVSLKAPAKSGKTFALTAFALAFLLGDYSGLRSYADKGDKVLIIDTEQSRNDTRKILHRIRSQAPKELKRVEVLNLRNVESCRRLAALALEVELFRPALIVVDGIADLIPGMDYNDQEAADQVITALGNIAEQHNAVVATAIHTNNKDEHATGWLGRLLKQKCALELIVKRENKSSVRRIECSAVRHREVQPIAIDIVDTDDNLGRVVVVSPTDADAAARDAKRAEYRAKLQELGFDVPLHAPRQQIRQMIMQRKTQIDGRECSRQNADGIIRRCIDVGAFRTDGESLIFDI